MQRYLLARIGDPRLKVYVVWGPMLGPETEDDARAATSFVPDGRAMHFWTPVHTLAEQLRAPAGLTDELAWDTFLLFAPGVRWAEAPPAPSRVQHVGKRLPAEQRFNGEKLAAEARRLLTLDGSTR